MPYSVPRKCIKFANKWDSIDFYDYHVQVFNVIISTMPLPTINSFLVAELLYVSTIFQICITIVNYLLTFFEPRNDTVIMRGNKPSLQMHFRNRFALLKQLHCTGSKNQWNYFENALQKMQVATRAHDPVNCICRK